MQIYKFNKCITELHYYTRRLLMINVKCPKCGSTKVQLSNENSRHGCLFTILFSVWYLIIVLCRWIIGALLFFVWDWYMALIHKARNKGHIWQCRKWFSGKKRIYYCHDCGYNFRA